MRKSLRRLILLWHRWLGLASVPFVVLLVVTGVLLERTDRLELDQTFVSEEWLLAWYGIAASDDPISYRAGEQWVSWLGDTLYLDGTPVQQAVTSFRGAVALGPAIVAATSEALYLFTPEGELVEKVTPIGIGSAVDAVAVAGDANIVVRADGVVFLSDIDMVDWRASVDAGISWPGRQITPDAVRTAILKSYRGMGLPWERVLLDLHSGRLFGAIGPYLMDGAAVLLLLLSASGIYNWVRRR